MKNTCLIAGILLAALLNSFGQPIITTEPQSRTNVVGTDATFTVLATGAEPLTYQWRFSTTDLAGKTNDTLIVTNVQTANAGSYTVVVTNVDGAVTSAVATLTVPVPPTITRQPTNQSASLGANVTFSVLTAGTTPRYFQWRFNETNLLGKTSTSLVVTNAQLTNAGDYTVVVTNVAGSVTSLVAHLDIDPAFTKITSGSIVTEVGTGTACAWGDYDNDGFIDLIVPSAFNPVNGTPQKNILFHNNRDGTFTKVTNTVVSVEARDWRGCSWVDYDNDGNLDLFVTSTDANGFAAQNELFRNNGDGTFIKMTANNVGAIAALFAGGSEGPAWADYDNDGFVDVFVARYGIDWLYHNDGDGSFSGITNVLAGPVRDDSYDTAWGDYNNDGRPDLFVAVKSDPPTNRLYLNLGDGNFSRVTSGNIATDSAHSFGCAWGDYDNDSYLDLFVASGFCECSEPSSLYHNNGDGTFTGVTNGIGGSILTGAGVFLGEGSWGDYDNDGFLDLFLPSVGGKNFLFHNNGDGSFSRILSGSLVNDIGIFAISGAWGDYDNDGFLDLFIARGGDAALETNLLYRNNGNANGWLKVKLVGTLSNRSAIGAKVRVKATIQGRTLWQLREINTGNGFTSSPLEAHFGLGNATNIDTVRIEWPSGIVQTMTNVAAKQFLTVLEHQETAAARPNFTGVSRSTDGAVNLSVAGDTGLLYMLEASTNLLNWTKLSVRSNATGIVGFTDPRATNYTKRFYRVSVP